MKLPLVSRLLTFRRLLRTLDRIAYAQEAQALSLQRLADRYAPLPLPDPAPEDLRAHTGLTFSRDAEMVKIQEFEERCLRDLKRAPTDEEILNFLEGIEQRL